MLKYQSLYWRAESTPAELVPLLRNLGAEYPVRAGRPPVSAIQLRFEKIAAPGTLRVERRGDEILVQYAAPALAARALGCIWAGAVHPGRVHAEQTPFKTLGVMPDCSRNSVLTVAHFKQWLRRCALLGYNQAMLYTEDVYELPGEPYFGYMRGAYTEAELREIDRYAAAMGIEMVACIQTLGHMAHVFKWPAYARIKDTNGTLLTLVPETYALIDKMLGHWSKVFKSRRINLGMDEAVDIGKGRGSDRHGPLRPANELFFNHLKKVAALCRKHGLQPMIWSDLVFWVDTPARGFQEAYYDVNLSAAQAKSIRTRLPDNIELIYWDYTGDVQAPTDPTPYVRRIAKHRAVGREPVMASGCWAWGRFWHDAPNLTEPRVAACVQACRKTGVRELLMTLWTGMDGVDLDSAWAGLAYSAEQAFFKKPSRKLLEQRYRAVCHADYRASAAGALDIFWVPPPGLSSAKIFWDDPLQWLYLRSLPRPLLRRIARYYRGKAVKLARWRGATGAGDMDYIRNLAEFLGRKTELYLRLQAAYRGKSRAPLRQARCELHALLQVLRNVQKTFRRMWLRQFKPFGMEVVQARHAGLAARLTELDQRLGELLDGKIDGIAELDAPALPARSKGKPK